MKFKPLTLKEIEIVRPFLERLSTRTCDFSVGGMFMWRDFFHTEFALEDGVFYSRLHGEGQEVYYNLPVSRDPEGALRALVDREGADGRPVRFCTVPEDGLPLFDWLGRTVSAAEEPDFFDYLYRAEDLAGLRGKKYSGQRNQISQFKRSVSAWEFRPMGREEIGRAAAFFEERYLSSAGGGPYEREENAKVLEVLERFDEYGMEGGLLSADGAVAGFSLHEIIGDTMYTHVEKADRRVKGAYQMLVSQAAAAFAEGRVLYINREEDMGDEGLRRSKQSYHPLKLLKKYTVEVR